MAFCMYAGQQEAHIESYEEYIFDIAQEDKEKYPALMSLWVVYYKSPRLQPEQACSLTHELIELLSENGGSSNKDLSRLVLSLLPFFSLACRNGEQIRCSSD